MVMGASPAAAQAEVASAQASGSVHKLADGAASPLGQGNDEFEWLFANWKSLDNGTGMPAPARASVSVPSRMPLDGMTLTSGFGMRRHPILGGRRNHKGIDLAAPTGTPVYATADGIVAKAERFSTYGNYIQIEHGGELQSRFAHLSGYAVAAGDRVKKGDLIGYVGSTGRSTGPHLHYEIRVGEVAVDPTPYMTEGVELAVTDPDGAKGGPEE